MRVSDAHALKSCDCDLTLTTLWLWHRSTTPLRVSRLASGTCTRLWALGGSCLSNIAQFCAVCLADQACKPPLCIQLISMCIAIRGSYPDIHRYLVPAVWSPCHCAATCHYCSTCGHYISALVNRLSSRSLPPPHCTGSNTSN